MRNRWHSSSRVEARRAETKTGEPELELPRPTASYRRRAWAAFQRALDPLAPLKPPPRPPF